MKDNKWTNFIRDSVEKLVYKKGQPNSVVFLIDKKKGYWVQILKGTATQGDDPAENASGYSGEAVCNRYIKEKWHLTEEQEDDLIELGWDVPELEDANYSSYWEDNKGHTPPALVKQVFATMTKVYGWDANQKLETEYIDVL